jgi:hypothetical protein
MHNFRSLSIAWAALAAVLTFAVAAHAQIIQIPKPTVCVPVPPIGTVCL